MTLRDYVDLRGVTHAALAATCGCSVAQMRSLLYSWSHPSLDLARRIERATDGAVRLSDWSTATKRRTPRPRARRREVAR